MNRRRCLAGVGLSVVLPGCLSGVGTDSESGGGDETDETRENDTADGFDRVVSIADTDDLPDRAPITFDLRVLEDRITGDETAFL